MHRLIRINCRQERVCRQANRPGFGMITHLDLCHRMTWTVQVA